MGENEIEGKRGMARVSGNTRKGGGNGILEKNVYIMNYSAILVFRVLFFLGACFLFCSAILPHPSKRFYLSRMILYIWIIGKTNTIAPKKEKKSFLTQFPISICCYNRNSRNLLVFFIFNFTSGRPFERNAIDWPFSCSLFERRGDTRLSFDASNSSVISDVIGHWEKKEKKYLNHIYIRLEKKARKRKRKG